MTIKRRHRLVEAGGREVFEVRVVQWIGDNGKFYTSAEVTSPDPATDIALVEVLGAMELAKHTIREMYED